VYYVHGKPPVWREVFGFDPGPQGLVDMLDRGRPLNQAGHENTDMA
jgi:hypothetical protein